MRDCAFNAQLFGGVFLGSAGGQQATQLLFFRWSEVTAVTVRTRRARATYFGFQRVPSDAV